MGVPRILDDLRDVGTRTSKRRCGRLMRAAGLRGRKKHARQPQTTDSRHAQPVAPNLIAERPAPTGPNQCWLTDIMPGAGLCRVAVFSSSEGAVVDAA